MLVPTSRPGLGVTHRGPPTQLAAWLLRWAVPPGGKWAQHLGDWSPQCSWARWASQRPLQRLTPWRQGRAENTSESQGVGALVQG